jgi:tRNA 2-thiouridine synthesizing protein E
MATALNQASMTTFDPDGFLHDPAQWSHEWAEQLARQDGLPALGAEHWHVLAYLREHYIRYGAVPSMGQVCWLNGMDRHCMTELFPSPREAWRLAGLPNPGEEAKAYM